MFFKKLWRSYVWTEGNAQPIIFKVYTASQVLLLPSWTTCETLDAFNFHSCLILQFEFWVIHCNPGVALSYLEWWFEIIWKGWVNKLSREHHLQHIKTSSSSMSHWFPVWFSAFNLRWSPQLALRKEALVLVTHGQNAGSDGGSFISLQLSKCSSLNVADFNALSLWLL